MARILHGTDPRIVRGQGVRSSPTPGALIDPDSCVRNGGTPRKTPLARTPSEEFLPIHKINVKTPGTDKEGLGTRISPMFLYFTHVYFVRTFGLLVESCC